MTKAEAETQLAAIAALEENWDTYGAPPFNADTLAAGRSLVDACFASEWPPDRVDAGEGVTVSWRGPLRRYANIETGDGDELWAVTSTGGPGADGITVWQVVDFDQSISRIRDFISGGAK